MVCSACEGPYTPAPSPPAAAGSAEEYWAVEMMNQLAMPDLATLKKQAIIADFFKPSSPSEVGSSAPGGDGVSVELQALNIDELLTMVKVSMYFFVCDLFD
jgi:hypothetical protein